MKMCLARPMIKTRMLAMNGNQGLILMASNERLEVMSKNEQFGVCLFIDSVANLPSNALTNEPVN
jgi:hypothetical protein